MPSKTLVAAVTADALTGTILTFVGRALKFILSSRDDFEIKLKGS
jgi:hypothetical protein